MSRFEMDSLDLNKLPAFIAVARERSFTRAAAQLGMSQSALSHAIRKMEESLGLRLLTRTTRGVSPTEAGERLLAAIGPHYAAIQSGLSAMAELRDTPAGTFRISAHDHAASTILWPKLSPLLQLHPDLNIEISISYGMIDIVAERYDAGVRIGGCVAKDMVAVRIGPDLRMVVAGSPAYFKRHPPPATPAGLLEHNCVNLRLPTHGGLYAWEFARHGQEQQIQVRGQMVFNTTPQMLTAALEGHGLAYVPQEAIARCVADGHLLTVLDDWCPAIPGYHLYYPSRRQSSPAFQLVVDTLRYQP